MPGLRGGNYYFDINRFRLVILYSRYIIYLHHFPRKSHHHNFNPDPNTPALSLSRRASASPLYNSASTDRK